MNGYTASVNVQTAIAEDGNEYPISSLVWWRNRWFTGQGAKSNGWTGALPATADVTAEPAAEPAEEFVSDTYLVKPETYETKIVTPASDPRATDPKPGSRG